MRKYNPATTMLGAENREFVTCYLDSLLFAMFARMDSFEGILSGDGPDPATNTLATVLRLWVNMLRSGKLITTDIVWQTLLWTNLHANQYHRLNICKMPLPIVVGKLLENYSSKMSRRPLHS